MLARWSERRYAQNQDRKGFSRIKWSVNSDSCPREREVEAVDGRDLDAVFAEANALLLEEAP
jgi:hypothetical protein